MPATLVVDGLLVRRAEFAVFANEFRVYPFGFGFIINVLRQPRLPGEDYDLRSGSPFGNHRRARGREAEHGRDLRIDVRFADGRGAATGPGPRLPHAAGARPEPPVISMRGGNGGNGRWQQNLWVWGLPEEGDVNLVCSWAAEEVPESRLELDGDALREAAAHATLLWPEPDEEEEEEDDDAAS